MGVTIQEVRSRKDLKEFVSFPFRLYRGHPSWIPPLIADELETFDPARNPAYENAESRQWLALRDGRPVGRIAAIVSRAANEKWKTRNMRFGWFDAEDDPEAALALFGAVEAWARERDLATITGPHGFCDFDPNGMLVDGFGELATLSGNYNHPYLPSLVERAGFAKEIDYVEFKTFVPKEGLPERVQKLAERVKARSSFRIAKFRSKKEVIARAPELFRLLDEAYEETYGAVPLTARQVAYYIKKYISYVDPELITVAVNDKDEMVGFMITMPSLSRALQKARGRLFPAGWVHVLRGLKQCEIIDFLLAGIRKDARGLGVDLLMTFDLAQTILERGFVWAESNQELETNTKIQAQWKFYNPVQHKRRRVYKKNL